MVVRLARWNIVVIYIVSDLEVGRGATALVVVSSGDQLAIEQGSFL